MSREAQGAADIRGDCSELNGSRAEPALCKLAESRDEQAQAGVLHRSRTVFIRNNTRQFNRHGMLMAT